MNNLIIIASELNRMGFSAKVLTSAVEVKLTNRKVSQMEVREALEQTFEGIRFNLQSTSDSVLVS
jgi:hypothetical protein